MSLRERPTNEKVLLERHAGPDALAKAAAKHWLDRLAASPVARERWGVGLSGGRIAARLFDSAVSQARQQRIPWDKVEFFFADDRWVPLDHAESNFRLAQEHLFVPLRISGKSVHPLYLGNSPAFDAAQAQAELLHRVPIDAAGHPILDLVILGMGEDGHVASLFPNAPAEVVESRAVYLPVVAPKPPPCRVTLTYAALAAAREVLVVVYGAGKEPALSQSLSQSVHTPLGRLIGLRERTVVLAVSPHISQPVVAEGAHQRA